jgi:hypothetical protein
VNVDLLVSELLQGGSAAACSERPSCPSHEPECHTALQERLPSPFGLVRTGVAPDHADTKVRKPPAATRSFCSRALTVQQAQSQAHSNIAVVS